MKKIYFILLILVAPMLFGNFGLIEYAVLHPKTTPLDSVNRKQKQVTLYATAEPKIESNPEEEKENQENTQLSWAEYIRLVTKTILGFLLKLLAKF